MKYTLSLYKKNLLRHSRWLILLAFPLSGIASYSINGVIESFFYFMIAMLACAFLLRSLNTLAPETLGIWVALFVFIIFYFLRFPIILFDPSPVMRTHPDNIRNIFRDPGGLYHALKLTVFFFVVFCLIVGLQLRRFSKAASGALPPQSFSGNQFALIFLSLITFLMVVLGYVSYVYQIGVMGVPVGEPLPFRLRGIVFYAWHVTVPIFILALICQGTVTKNRGIITVGLAFLALHGVSDMLLRSSRSSLLLCLLLIFFLSGSGGLQIRRKGIALLGFLALIPIFLMPIIMRYRALRVNAYDKEKWDLAVQAVQTIDLHFLTVLKNGLLMLYFRIPGIETLWAVHSSVTSPLGSKLLEIIQGPSGVAGFLTFTLYRVAENAYTLWAPGFLGWFFIAGGSIGIVASGAMLAILCVQLPRLTYSGHLQWPAIANVFFLWVLFISLTDGTLDSNFFLIGTGIASLAALELTVRLSTIFSKK